MKYFLLCLALQVSLISFAQSKTSNICDPTILTAQELDKCRMDSIWSEDIQVKIDYLISLKTEILPAFRRERQNLALSSEVSSDAKILKKLYDSIAQYKLDRYEIDSDKNALYVQPRSYVASLLTYQIFKFYPDVYAILLNPVHANLTPKSKLSHLQFYEKQVEMLYNKISRSQFSELSTIVIKLRQEKEKYANGNRMEIFQGEMDENRRLQYDVVNFLIWDE